MKKLFSLVLSFALLAGAAGSLMNVNQAVEANAEEAAIEITPFAHYEFLDAENPGKDTSGNNFDLLPYVTSSNPEALQVKQDEQGENYLQLVSERNADGSSANLNKGGCLYAPELGTSGKDFSDLITGSFSVAFTFRRDNTTNRGDHYSLATGRYNDSFQITPWKNCVGVQLENYQFAPGATHDEKQQHMESCITDVPKVTTDWTTVIAIEDADTNTAYIYIDGQLMVEKPLTGVAMTRQDSKYVFTLGAQSEANGTTANATIGFATVDIKECRVYDSALTAENVAQLMAGNEATVGADTEYIASVQQLNAEDYDLLATDVNTIDKIGKEVLPQQVKINLAVSGVSLNAPVTWYPVKENGVNKIKGYVHSSYARTAPQYSFEYGYTIRLEYDSSKVTVTQVKLNNMAYTPGTPIEAKKQYLSFKVRAASDNAEVTVSYLDFGWDPIDEDGVYQLEVTGGAHVYIEAELPSGKVSYYDGEELLGTTTYTFGGSEALYQPEEKEGYTFVGWYTDEECTQQFAGLDYDNPKNITLYAKYQANNNNQNQGGQGGEDKCKGSLSGGTFGLIGLAAAVAFIGKKRR